jgi:protein-S-isoprenylcysteine O-methyltransferase Ste14
MNAAAWIAIGVAGGLLALTAWAWRELERIEWKNIEQQRLKELADHDAFLRTIGAGPQLVRKPLLTEEQIIHRAIDAERKPSVLTDARKKWTP